MQLVIDIGDTQPRYPIYLTVYPDGKALMSSGADLYEAGVKTLGEHGRLVDADLFYKSLIDLHKSDNLTALDVYNAITGAQTVLEATI